MNDGFLATLASELVSRQEMAGALPAGAGLAVGLVGPGGTEFRATFGLRERDRLLPVTRDTAFEIGSLTKAFTATALLIAAERVGLDLDRPINSLAALTLRDPEVSQQLSIADILSHRTGLPSNDLLWYFGSLDREGLLRAIAHLALLPDGFRRTFTYSNLMYGALGHLFPELVGDTWERYVSRNVAGPLGLGSTSFRPASSGPDAALPYSGTRHMAGVDLTSVAAAGGMKSSLEDMIRWMRFQLADGKAPSGDRLASQRMIQRMRTSHIVVENANPVLFIGLGWLANGATYGLGWFLSSWNGLTVIFHPGFIDGFSAVIALIPQKQLACAVLSNVNLSDTPGLLVRELFEGVLAPDALRDVSADAKRSPHSGVSVAGIYDNPAYGSVSVDHGSSGMVLRYREREWTLTWTSSTEADFAVEAFGAVIPLKVRFDVESGVASRLQIPFSLDPRVDADVFTRR